MTSQGYFLLHELYDKLHDLNPDDLKRANDALKDKELDRNSSVNRAICSYMLDRDWKNFNEQLSKSLNHFFNPKTSPNSIRQQQRKFG